MANNESVKLENPKYFRGQQPDEKFICFFRHHWFSMFKDFIYFGLLITGVVLFISNFDVIQPVLVDNESMELLFFLLFLLGTVYMHRFFLRLFNLFLDVGIITDMRIIDHQKTLFLKDTMDSIDMAQIQNLEKVEEGILPKILGYGHIKIFLNASSAIKTFHDLPNPAFLFKTITIQKEHRQYKMFRERGVVEVEAQAPDPESVQAEVKEDIYRPN